MKHSVRTLFLLMFAVSLSNLFAGCSGGGGGGGSEVASATTPASPAGSGNTPGPPSEGVLLEGDPASLAASVWIDYDSGDRTTEDEISTAPDGTRIDRTNVSIAFVGTATVNDINTLLNSINGRIVNMLTGVNIALVKIPDPGDLATLETVIAQIEASPFVRTATKATMGEPDQLPANYDWLTSDLHTIDHNIAVGAPAAWNAKAAVDYEESIPPLLVLADAFGGGVPDVGVLAPADRNDEFNLTIVSADEFGSGGANSHGYHVLGIISGRHNDVPTALSERELVTGIYPDALAVRVADVTAVNRPAWENMLVTIIKAFNMSVVLNTSLHSGCSRPPELDCVKPFTLEWIEKIRGSTAYEAGTTGALEDRYIHLTSAGNFRGVGIDSTDAKLNSQYAAAALLPDLQTSSGVSIANVSNTLVVENRGNTVPPNKPGCLSDTSKFPGDISAIGHEVWSFTGSTSGANNKSGTSMSTPQVAGLAAYVWALDPQLTPLEVIKLLELTASTPSTDSSCPTAPKPVIDAYAAILAVDDNSVLTAQAVDNPFDAPARLAILDISDESGNEGTANRKFDHHDLNLFIQNFTTRAGFNLDYSRYDLNGDGYTGGTEKKARFNLDIDPNNQYQVINHDIDNEPTSFDENAVSDWEVLCYYAYSPMYTGDDAMLDSLLTPYKLNCGASSDLTHVLFTRAAGAQFLSRAVYSMIPNGGNVTRLTTDAPFVFSSDPSWSPDLLKVLYVHGNAGNKDIWVVDRDGTSPTNLINDLRFPNDPGNTDRDDAEPEWSPDGSKIVFERSRGAGGSIGSTGAFIYSMNADGTGMTKLTPDVETALEGDPTWSPSGEQIAFWSFRDGNAEIYVMNADGSIQVRLTEDECCVSSFDIAPAWSPGGSKIYFRSNRDGNWEIYSMNADGSGQTNLTNSPEDEEEFALAPEGSKIAYRRLGANGTDVFVRRVPLDNIPELNISNRGDVGGRPLWSPDSTEIMFTTTSEIFVVNVNSDGSNLRDITNDANSGGFPQDWK